MNTRSHSLLGVTALSATLLLSACGNSGNSNRNAPTPEPAAPIDYRVTVTNLTASQPLSPIAVIMHSEQWQAFALGSAASAELEQLAESGSPSDLITAADGDDSVAATSNGSEPLAPGASESFDLSIDADTEGTIRLSVVSMLVNTNDAIAAINGADVSALEPAGSSTMRALTYDSGTEANSESATTIPGPVAGGEGFSATRDDVQDFVHIHAGVVGNQDGLPTSVLTGIHKWDHPAMQVTVERLN